MSDWKDVSAASVCDMRGTLFRCNVALQNTGRAPGKSTGRGDSLVYG
jgi:hypothetical protein